MRKNKSVSENRQIHDCSEESARTDSSRFRHAELDLPSFIRVPGCTDHVDIDEKDIVASMVPEYAQPWDKEVERRVVRKIDFALIPLMWIGYGLVYYDKVKSASPGSQLVKTDASMTITSHMQTSSS